MSDTAVKTRIKSIDVIRLICAVGIIVYHFGSESAGPFRPFWAHANGSWGNIHVTVFFLVSGAMLYYNDSRIPSLKHFYYKRWKSVFPAFYLAFAFFFLHNVFQTGNVFYQGDPWKLLLAIPAMDGYFSYLVPNNYYLVGEWFLGAIILCYLLYPLLLKAFQKSAHAATAVLLAAYAAVLNAGFFRIETSRNLICVLLCFETGMLLMRYRSFLLDRPKAAVPAFVLLVILTTVRLPFDNTFLSHIAGLCLFLVLYHFGNRITENETIAALVRKLEHGGLSYAVFLLQHQIIYRVIRVKDPSEPWKVLVMLAVTTVLTFLYAKALLAVTNAALNSETYQKIEQRLLN